MGQNDPLTQFFKKSLSKYLEALIVTSHILFPSIEKYGNLPQSGIFSSIKRTLISRSGLNHLNQGFCVTSIEESIILCNEIL